MDLVLMDKTHSQNASGATDRVLSRRCTGFAPRPPAPDAHSLDASFNDSLHAFVEVTRIDGKSRGELLTKARRNIQKDLRKLLDRAEHFLFFQAKYLLPWAMAPLGRVLQQFCGMSPATAS